jgi:diguanylate cyclase (GGDEF)-like protein/PAS domain S-box-containing protein
MRPPSSSATDPTRPLRYFAGAVCVTGVGLSAASLWWLGAPAEAGVALASSAVSLGGAWWRPLPLLCAMGGLGGTLAVTWALMDAARRWRQAWRAGGVLMREKQDSQQMLRKVMGHTADGVLTFDEQGLVLSANRAAAQIFQDDEASLIGRHVASLIGEPMGANTEAMPHALSRLGVDLNGCGLRIHGRWPDGFRFPLELTVIQLPDGEAPRYLALTRDLSAQEQASRAALEARRQLDEVDEMRRVIVHNAPYAIFVLNAQGIIQTVNPAGEKLVGFKARELVGRSSTQRFFDPEMVADRARMLALRLNQPVQELNVLEHLAAESPGVPSEWTLRRADGSFIVTEITVTELRDEHGVLTGYLTMAYDVTSRRDAEYQLQHMAQHDALTSLPNRNMLQEQLKACMALAERQHHPLALMFLDIDRFKKINDGLGHQAGDQVLVEVAKRLRGAMRNSDIVARLGGDEFVVLLPEISAVDDAERVATKVLELFAEPVLINGQELRVTPSIGVAIYPDDGRDSITLMRHADLAMYQAKSNGRNRVQIYSDTMSAPSADTLVLENDLYKALERDELCLHFQPQFDCHSGRITGAEALLRWNHGGRLVPPSDFIPLAEETGLIVPIGEWVLRRACTMAQGWRQRTGWPLRVAVNLSAVQLDEADVPALVVRVLADTGLPATALELEITESVVVRESLRAADILSQVRALGVGVAIDDFGVGYSSFSYLRELPVDRFKLDRSFLSAIPHSQGDARLMAALIAMGHRLNVGIVAEGVETAEQAAFLVAHGCDEAQGYHLGRPVPEAAFAALLVAHVEAMRRQPKAEAPMMAEVSVAQAQAPLEGSTATASAESAEA